MLQWCSSTKAPDPMMLSTRLSTCFYSCSVWFKGGRLEVQGWTSQGWGGERERERARERASTIFITRQKSVSVPSLPPIIDMRQVALMRDLQNTNNCCASISIPAGSRVSGGCITVAIIPDFIMMHRLRSGLVFGARCVWCNYTMLPSLFLCAAIKTLFMPSSRHWSKVGGGHARAKKRQPS